MLALLSAFGIWFAERGGNGAGGAPHILSPSGASPVVSVGVRVPEPTLPPRSDPHLTVTATGGDGLEMRMVAQAASGALVRGPWSPVAPTLSIPAAISHLTETGQVSGRVEVRDDGGGVARSGWILVPPTPGVGRAQVVRAVVTSTPDVALVFDDGVDPAGMARIIATLRATGAGGTFCLNGINGQRWPESLRVAMRRAVVDGVLSLCSHGWSHRTSTSTTRADALHDLSANAAIDRSIGVSAVPFYRPPYGALNPGIEAAAGALGYRWIVLWNVDPSDYTRPDAATLARRVVRSSSKGSIAVLHALGTTADALPAMIRGLRARGLEPVTLARLLSSGTPSSTGAA